MTRTVRLRTDSMSIRWLEGASNMYLWHHSGRRCDFWPMWKLIRWRFAQRVAGQTKEVIDRQLFTYKDKTSNPKDIFHKRQTGPNCQPHKKHPGGLPLYKQGAQTDPNQKPNQNHLSQNQQCGWCVYQAQWRVVRDWDWIWERGYWGNSQRKRQRAFQENQDFWQVQYHFANICAEKYLLSPIVATTKLARLQI